MVFILSAVRTCCLCQCLLLGEVETCGMCVGGAVHTCCLCLDLCHCLLVSEVETCGIVVCVY